MFFVVIDVIVVVYACFCFLVVVLLVCACVVLIWVFVDSFWIWIYLVAFCDAYGVAERSLLFYYLDLRFGCFIFLMLDFGFVTLLVVEICLLSCARFRLWVVCIALFVLFVRLLGFSLSSA